MNFNLGDEILEVVSENLHPSILVNRKEATSRFWLK